jgi:hypothetical protein
MAINIARRKFIAALGGATVAWPIAARAQQSERVRHIGVLMAFPENDPEAQSWAAGFREELGKLGWGSILMSEKPSALKMRLGRSFLKTVDEWRRKQKDLPSRAEAICQLVERGLANRPPVRQLSKGAKGEAAKMAGREIDRLGDQTVTREERARRKRRLIKGPREFRDIRNKTKAETNSQ